MGARGMGARGIGARGKGAKKALRTLEFGGCSGEEEAAPEATSEPAGAAGEAGAALVAALVAIGNGSAVVTHNGCGCFGSGSRSLHA
jgi:hypothetical protein